MRSVHQAVLAVAVTGVVAAVRHRSSTSKATMPRATPATKTSTTARRKAAVPAQRRSEIEQLGLRVEELVVAEHDAQDARLFDALEWSAG